jgi:hypothetical protein
MRGELRATDHKGDRIALAEIDVALAHHGDADAPLRRLEKLRPHDLKLLLARAPAGGEARLVAREFPY